MTRRIVRWMLVPGMLLAVLPGCEGLLDDGNDAQRAEYRTARTLWDTKDLASYTFTLELACECRDPSDVRAVEIVVENGVPVSRTYLTDEAPPAPDSVFGAYDTVEELFDAVNAAITGDADLLRVGYNSTFGFPYLLQLDRSSRDPDDYLAFQVTEFDIQ